MQVDQLKFVKPTNKVVALQDRNQKCDICGEPAVFKLVRYNIYGQKRPDRIVCKNHVKWR